MHSTARTAAQLTLLCVFAFFLQTSNASKVSTPFKEANTVCTSDQYLCGCQAVPSSAYSRFGEFFHQSVQCSPLCEQQSCYQTCEQSACVYPMGSMGEWCAGLVEQKMVDFVRGATCYYDRMRRMTKCMKMTSVTYPDDQTYNAITQGYCIPTCGLNVGSFQCTFPGRFQYTSIRSDKMPRAPFTTITGVDFKHYGSAETVTATAHTSTHTEGHAAHTAKVSTHTTSTSARKEEESHIHSAHTSTSAHSSSQSHSSSIGHGASTSAHSESSSTVHAAPKTVDCSKTDEYLCGCQAVPVNELPKYKEFFNSPLSCAPLCTQTSCYQTCEKSACATSTGSQGPTCAAIVDQAMVDYVRSADCVYDPGMQMYECVKGGSVTYPDEQTYEAITEGYCFPTCDLNVGSIQCTFEGRFRDTYIYDSDLPAAPFTVITGTDFHHWGAPNSATNELVAAGEDNDGSVYQTGKTSDSVQVVMRRSTLFVSEESEIATNTVPAGCSFDYLCGCQVIPESTYSRFEHFFRQAVSCPHLCGQKSCSQSCAESVCVAPMGSQGQWCGGIIDQSMIDFVRVSSCSYDQGMRMYKCTKGSSVTYPDEQTYKAITTGYCVPSCGLDIGRVRCTFTGRFRDTSISSFDRATPPFTIVTGLDFRHWEKETVTETVTTVTEEPSTHAEETEVTKTHEEKFKETVHKHLFHPHEEEEVETEKPEETVTTTEETEKAVTTKTTEEPGARGKEAETRKTHEERVKEAVRKHVVHPHEEEEVETEKPEEAKTVTTTKESEKAAKTETTEETKAKEEETRVEEKPYAIEVKTAKEETPTVEEVPGETGPSKKARTKETTEEAAEKTAETVEVPQKTATKTRKEKTEEEEEAKTKETETSVTAEAKTKVVTEKEEEVGAGEEQEFELGTLSEPEGEETESESTSEEESAGTEEASQESRTSTRTSTTTTTASSTETTGTEAEEAKTEEETEESEESRTRQPSERTGQRTRTVTTAETTESTVTETSTETEAEEVGTEEETTAGRTESTVTAEEVTVEEIRGLPANDNSLYYGPFGECSQVCSEAGPSYKERSIICRNYAGVPVSLNNCDLPDDFNEEFYEECEVDSCAPGNYVFLSEWSECEKKCAPVMADGMALPNWSNREIECRSVRGDKPLDKSQCTNMIAKMEIRTRKTCNSIPCIRYGYQVGNWKACDCKKWIQKRDVSCVRLPTNRKVSNSMCNTFKLEPPASERRCFPEKCFNKGGADGGAESDYCQFSKCSKKGDCEDGKCKCKWGFDGVDCQQDIRSQPRCGPPSLWNKDGSCCASGVFDSKGACCEGTNEEVDCDIRGECCQGKPLDGCGFCSGDIPRFLDSAGQCCEVLDASGTCCESGHVDECGVCDGSGTSCKSKIDFNVRISGGQDLKGCGDELDSVITEAFDLKELTWAKQTKGLQTISFTNKNVAFASGLIWHKVNEVLKEKDLDAFCTVRSVKTSKVPICGNGICEIGEPMNCVKDCDYRIKMCEKQRGRFNEAVMCNNHGLCSIKDAQCICFDGYEGKNCDKCSSGFFHVGDDGRCIASEAFTSRPTLNEDKTPINMYLLSRRPIFVT